MTCLVDRELQQVKLCQPYEEQPAKQASFTDQIGIPSVSSIAFGLVALFLFLVLLNSLRVVRQQTVVVVERLGKFHRVLGSGLRMKIPIIESFAHVRGLAIGQNEIDAETKTKDNVFVDITVAIQKRIVPTKVFESVYLLNDPNEQIEAYVLDVVRAKVPGLTLDELFERKAEIADAIEADLSARMNEYGYQIVSALVTEIEPAENVVAAMNEINVAQRERVAAAEKGEADRIIAVKAAEAEAQSKALQGKGIADQRKAIVDGLRESVEHFREGVPGATPQDVMNLVLMTQYFDTLKEIGVESNTIMLPHSPGALGDLMTQIQAAMRASESK